MPGPAYQPAPIHPILGDQLYDPVRPALFPRHVLRFRNDAHAARVGLDDLDDAAWIAHFGRFEPLPGNLPDPLALRYHGHQFGSYNPELGDGRGFLFAQLRDERGRLLDLGTKGSGRTPWSRGGDGRLTLKGGFREILATEMLAALGVDTSHTFSLVETGESLHRHDEPSPTRAAVLVRLSHSHIRFGTFQRLAYHGQTDAIARLVDHVLTHLYPQLVPGPSPALTLLEAVTARMADLAASYMVAGFVHGVLNTDNLNITGESFDYGPYRFAPRWDPAFVAAYFDHTGLYRFGRQPEAIRWGVERLAETFLPLADEAALIEVLRGFEPAYRTALLARFVDRLGVVPSTREADQRLVEESYGWLRTSRLSLDQFFFDAYGGAASRERALEGPVAHLWRDPASAGLRRLLWDRVPSHPERLELPCFQRPEPCSLIIDELEALWDAVAVADDWDPLHAKVAAIREMGAATGHLDSAP